MRKHPLMHQGSLEKIIPSSMVKSAKPHQIHHLPSIHLSARRCAFQSKHRPLRRLRKLLMLRQRHVPRSSITTNRQPLFSKSHNLPPTSPPPSPSHDPSHPPASRGIPQRKIIVCKTHRLSSIKIVSMVYSLFHCARQGSLDGSTRPVRWSTHGRLTRLLNWTVGGESG